MFKNFFCLLVSRPKLGDSAPLELESHQLTGSPPDWGNLGLDVSETPKPEPREGKRVSQGLASSFRRKVDLF